MVWKASKMFVLRLTHLLTLSLTPCSASAEVLFEGYYRILNGSLHVGYAVSRYEVNPKTKEFISVYFLKTSALGGQVTESLIAKSKQDLSPISYQYSSLVAGTSRTIDATVKASSKGRKLAVTIKAIPAGGDKGAMKTEHKEVDLPKNTIFSTFLAYAMLQSKAGLRTNAKYDYDAVAEEDGEVFAGTAFVKSQEDYNGYKAYKILNEFKNTKFLSYANEKGEVLATKSPTQGIATELASQPGEATGNQALPTTTLTTLFGTVPMGLENAVSKEKSSKAQKLLDLPPAPQPSGMPAEAPPTQPAEDQNTNDLPGKTQGVPGGKGLIIKPKTE